MNRRRVLPVHLLSILVGAVLLIVSDALLAFNPSPSGPVYDVLVLDDGRIVIAGDFQEVAGESASRVARLNPDGTLDQSFSSPGVSDSIRAVAVQPDGKLLIGGTFTNVGGQTRNRLARLNEDGSVDMSFIPEGLSSGSVAAIAIQSDGKTLVGGNFGRFTESLWRLNPDGSLDDTFDARVQSNRLISSIAIQSDGRILIGGNFTTVADVTRNRIARLNADGSLDTEYNPNANNSVWSLKLQPDGKVLVGGDFSMIGGDATHAHIARLNLNGSVDPSFSPPEFNAPPGFSARVCGLGVQNDGKVVLAGIFSSPREDLARLLEDGSLDATFGAGAPIGGGLCASNGNGALTLQDDGKILIVGSFTHIGDVPRQNLARLNPDGSVDGDSEAPAPVVTPDHADFGEVEVGELSTAMTLTLATDGNANLTITDISSVVSPFARTGGTCPGTPFTLTSTQSCTLIYRFGPVAAGSFDQTMAVSSSQVDPVEIPLTGVGVKTAVPQLTVTPSILTFPPVPIGTPSMVRTATLASVGSAPVEVDAIDEAQIPFARVGGDCPTTPFSLAPTESCTLDFQFTPVELDLAKQVLEISSNAGVATLQLAGMGEAVPILEAAPSTLNFGEIEVDELADAQTVTLTSSGNADVTVTGILPVAAPFARAGGTCSATPFTLAPSQSCTLIYRFGPTAVGEFSQVITVDNNAGALEIELLGAGVQTTLPPQISLNPDEVDIQLQSGNTAAQSLLIGNDGEDDLVWSLRIDGGPALAGPLPACELPDWLDLDPAGGTVTGGESGEAEIVVDAADLAVGTYDAELCIESNDPDRPLLTLPVNVQVDPAPPVENELFRDRFQNDE